jgi:amidase
MATTAGHSVAWRIPDDLLGAFCRVNHVALEPTGRGPLDGLAFAVKDVFHIAGHHTGFGHPEWLRTHPPATATAVAVKLLLAAGACMVGKTLTDELAYSLSGENMHYGTPVNPRCPQRIPGGSSNGSVVAVAGGLVDFALGTDCGGSVRLPASYCGVLGMRPTHGRVPLEGAIPFGPSFDTAGWFARTPEVLGKVGHVLLQAASAEARPSRALIARDAFALLDDPIRRTLEAPLEAVVRRLDQCDEVTVSPEGLSTWAECFQVLQAAEVWENHGAWIRQVKPVFGRGIRERMAWAATVRPEDVQAAQRFRTGVMRRLEQLLGPGDVLLLPTSPRIAPFKGTEASELEIHFRHQAMCLLCIAGLGGLPQVSLPLATFNGCPLGLSVVGRRGADLDLLACTASVMAHTAQGGRLQGPAREHV